MTERPQDFVGIPLIGAFDFFGCHPNALQIIGWGVRRNGHAPVGTGGFTVRFAAPPGDPDTLEHPQHRIERGGQPSVRSLADAVPLAHRVLIGLAIRDDDERGRVAIEDLRLGGNRLDRAHEGPCLVPTSPASAGMLATRSPVSGSKRCMTPWAIASVTGSPGLA